MAYRNITALTLTLAPGTGTRLFYSAMNGREEVGSKP